MGPTNSSGGANEVLGNIYREYISSSRGGVENFAESTNLQLFDSSHSTIKSPAVEMGFPFTCGQWKELERQAMVYKYMISSVPVSPHLLFPFSRNFTAPAENSSVSSIHNGRYSKNGDPEPGRCKRTDGKKWRCSRDVAPHQKYCERHLHRGRPRSRKPVEVKNTTENNKKTRLEQSKSIPTAQSNSAASQQFVSTNEPLLIFNAKTDLSIGTPYHKGTDRDLGLMMETENMVERHSSVEQQPWQHLIEANMGLLSDYSSYGPIFDQDYVDQHPMNVFSYPKFPTPEIEVPNGFIDAWSIDNLNTTKNRNHEPSISLNDGDLSPSLNLSMAMAAGNVLDEEMRNIQMGSNKDCDDETKDSIWAFARGGPLGEALHAIGGGLDPASPYNSISTPATTVSSPSGVLHRTVFSHSDGSVCNSPTFAAPPSEVSIQWFN
ncbi:hypothetical protein DH2020_036897 [Rehmannia glutinosa]|uniref:Growth-regulating factor n=1 Tax=Rehmannia glutinosa TaxID=99300 RepID=A0ABR0V371_REHGL